MGDDRRPDDGAEGIPKQIGGRYDVIRRIARGGMAEVWLARHADLERSVALKILRPPDESEEIIDFEERFRLEARTLASLDHPNIVTLHDFGQLDDGRCYLAMEYVDGLRLSDLLRSGPITPDRVVSLILQVCTALRYAHKAGVVHRDLKPSNLLIRVTDDGNEQVKVVDFGLVKLTEADQSPTRAGLILGSPHCMAPEQVKGLDVTPTADIYAVGVLLFRMVAGRYPFHGPNSAATMMAHLRNPVPSLAEVAPDFVAPRGLEATIQRCLAKDPLDRYPTMQALIDDLEAVLVGDPDAWGDDVTEHTEITVEGHSGARRGPAAATRRSPVGPLLLASGLLLAAGAAAIAWTYVEPPPASSVIPPMERAVEAAPNPVAEPAPAQPAIGTEPAIEAAPAPTASPEAATPVDRPRAKAPPAAPAPVTPSPPQPTKPVSKASEPEPSTPPAATDEAAKPEGYMGLPEDW